MAKLFASLGALVLLMLSVVAPAMAVIDTAVVEYRMCFAIHQQCVTRAFHGYQTLSIRGTGVSVRGLLTDGQELLWSDPVQSGSVYTAFPLADEAKIYMFSSEQPGARCVTVRATNLDTSIGGRGEVTSLDGVLQHLSANNYDGDLANVRQFLGIYYGVTSVDPGQLEAVILTQRGIWDAQSLLTYWGARLVIPTGPNGTLDTGHMFTYWPDGSTGNLASAPINAAMVGEDHPFVMINIGREFGVTSPLVPADEIVWPIPEVEQAPVAGIPDLDGSKAISQCDLDALGIILNRTICMDVATVKYWEGLAQNPSYAITWKGLLASEATNMRQQLVATGSACKGARLTLAARNACAVGRTLVSVPIQ